MSIPIAISNLFYGKTNFVITERSLEFGNGNRYFTATTGVVSRIKTKLLDGTYSSFYKDSVLWFLNYNALGKPIIATSDEVAIFITKYDTLKKCLLNSQTNY